MFSLFSNKKRTPLSIIGLIIFIIGFGVNILRPLPVHAQLPVTVTSDPQRKIGKVIKNAASTMMIQFMSKFINKMAYDAATALSDAARGKKPAVYKKPAGKYLADTASDASADAINNVMEKNLGFGICSLPDIELKANLQVNLSNIFSEKKPPKPDCTWTDAAKSFGEFKKNAADLNPANADEKFMESFKENTSFQQSGLGVGLQTEAKIGETKIKAAQKADLERKINEGFKPIKDTISGNVKTPADVVKHESKAATEKEKKEAQQQSMGDALASGAIAALTQGVSIFVNTLASNLLDQLLNPGKGGGLAPESEEGGFSSEFAGPAAGTREAAESAFSFLITDPPSAQLNQINLLSQLTACPSQPRLKSKYNCAMGQGLAQAIQNAQAGDPLTLQEALDQGIIENKPIIPPDHALNASRNCYKQGYCYSNIKKLRKARILPLGFEIAARNADPDQLSWTLKKVMEGFQDCNRGSGPIRDAEHPYCHLIDPNWVIKLPEQLCVGNEEPGPRLTREGGQLRNKRCVNIKTCIKGEGKNQECKGYGYCRKEENIWRLPGEQCPAHYNTCTTYFDDNNQAQSYLSRTLDFSSCSAGNVGCRAYSLEKKNGDWLSSVENISTSNSADLDLKLEEGRDKIARFDDDITDNTCSQESWGCTEFIEGEMVNTNTIEKTNQTTHLKQAPAYLSCYDSNPSTAETDRPQTITEAKSALNNNQQCSNFAAACVQEEVGCKNWDPVSQPGDELPAKIGNNTCPSACVGYGTFRQRETVFEPEINQLNFIPSDGESCSAQFEGCSEFTNIAERAEGGERLEYYTELQSCEEPTENNQKTFYTWSGQEGEGFKLERHQLAVYVDDPGTGSEDDYDYLNDLLSSPATSSIITTGSPKYNSFNQEQLQDFYTRCNEESYKTLIQNPRDPDAADPACRAYIDDSGETYYRLSNRLRAVSDQCHQLRKTDTNLAENEDINSSNFSNPANVCSNRGGTWDDINNDGNNECGVCRGGGTYEEGNCIYKTVSTPGGPNSCRGPSSEPDRFNGCRAYEGTTAGNVSTILEDTFEPVSNTSTALRQARAGWKSSQNTSLQTVAAALQTQMHSLKATFGGSNKYAERTIDANRLTQSTEEMDIKTKYELSFWARGNSQAVNITLEQPQNTDTMTANPISISGSWRKYTVGPTSFTGDPEATTTIKFETQASGNNIELFVDNVKLTEREGAVYLIKDSWKRTITYRGQEVEANVPLECDASPTDTTPGTHLGCTLYQDSLGNEQAATEFEQLCRPPAVGCKPMFKTHNSDSEQEEWFKVRASTSTKGGEATVTATIVTAGTNSTTVLGSCQTKPEEKTCFVDQITIPENITRSGANNSYDKLKQNNLVSSTMVVPADTASSSPIFITDREKFRCDESQQGCSKVAKQKQVLPDDTATSSYKFESSEYLLDDPDEYVSDQEGSGTLCQSDQIGCKRYTTQNQTTFFRDPEIAGARFCTYKEDVRPTINGTKQTAPARGKNGWFKEDVGVCKYDNKARPISDIRECNTDNDCTVGSTTGTCKFKGTIPCYANAQTVGGKFKLWSNKTNGYKGYVGKCPASQNQCTELVDRSDISPENPNGKPYYRIINQDLRDAQSACSKVSKKAGCILLDDTTDPAQKYNTEQSYEKSRQAANGERFNKVEPVTGDSTDPDVDADMIMEVEQDRQCKEWWSPSDQKLVYRNGQPEILTKDLRLCKEANESGQCINPVNVSGIGYCKTEPTKNCSDDNQCDQECVVRPQALTTDSYVNRDTSFSGWDYSGYSIHDMYSVNDFMQLGFSDMATSGVKKYLAYRVPSLYFTFSSSTNNLPESAHGEFFDDSCEQIEDDGGTPADPSDDQLGLKDNWSECGIFPPKGRCYKGMCIKPINKKQSFPDNLDPSIFNDFNTSTVFKDLIAPSLNEAKCKVYPEEDSPFPQTVLVDAGQDLSQQRDFSGSPKRYQFIRKQSRYANANVCQDGNCSCSYKKVEYPGNITDYWGRRADDIGSGTAICTSGEHKGQPCDPNGGNLENGNGNCSSVCNKPDSITQHLGTLGFCLEEDRSRRINGGVDKQDNILNACETWLPIQTSASIVDVYNNNPTAGYYPPEDSNGGGEVYCLKNRSNYTADNYTGRNNTILTDIESDNFLRDYEELLTQADSESNCNKVDLGSFVNTNKDVSPTDWNNGNCTIDTSGDGLTRISEINNLLLYYSGHVGSAGSGDADNEKAGAVKAIYRDLFRSDGRIKKYAGNNNSVKKCSEHADSRSIIANSGVYNEKLKDFRHFACLSNDNNWGNFSEDEENAFVELMNIWGWKELDNKGQSRLIRLEKDPFSGGGSFHSNKDFGYRTKQTNGDTFAVPLSFAPRGDNNNRISETLMHPPPFLKSLGSDRDNYSGVGYYKESSENYDRIYPYANRAFSVKFFDDTPDGVNNRDVRSDINGDSVGMRDLVGQTKDPNVFEGALNYAYFVPTRIPSGNNSDANTPALMSPITIPINALRSDLKSNPGNNTASRSTQIPKAANGNNKEFPSYHNDSLTQWSYVLTKTQGSNCNGLSSYCDYEQNDYNLEVLPVRNSNTSASQFEQSILNDSKNEVHRRYVSVVYHSNNKVSPNFISSQTPVEGGDDPFTVACGRGNDGGSWFAIGMDFNKNGKFLGYISRWCETHQANRGIQFATYIAKEDQCSLYASVYNNDVNITENTNKAWTNNVWGKGDQSFHNPPVTNLQNNNTYSALERSQSVPPFGSLVIGSQDVLNKNVPNLGGYVFSEPKFGVPLSCEASSSILEDYGGCENLRSDYNPRLIDDIEGFDSNPHDVLLEELFAKTFLKQKYSLSGSFNEEGGDDISGQINNIDPIGEEPKAPKVYSVNPNTSCRINESGGGTLECYAAEKGNMTVNGSTGFARDYDNDGNKDFSGPVKGNWEGLVEVQTFDTNLRFFAHADRNSMPIKRMIVDWQDQSSQTVVSNAKYGFYKNRKPYCGSSKPECYYDSNTSTPSLEKKYTGITCKNSDRGDEQCNSIDDEWYCSNNATSPEVVQPTWNESDEGPRKSFGNSSRACQEGFFQRSHTYTCGPADLSEFGKTVEKATQIPDDLNSQQQQWADPDGDGIYNGLRQRLASRGLTPINQKEVCVYRPKVQVLDNWGWCNGTCNGTEGCYNDGRFGKKCNGEVQGSNPWTTFKGKIIVIPQRQS